jgi:hypothetical protein
MVILCVAGSGALSGGPSMASLPGGLRDISSLSDLSVASVTALIRDLALQGAIPPAPRPKAAGASKCSLSVGGVGPLSRHDPGRPNPAFDVVTLHSESCYACFLSGALKRTGKSIVGGAGGGSTTDRPPSPDRPWAQSTTHQTFPLPFAVTSTTVGRREFPPLPNEAPLPGARTIKWERDVFKVPPREAS